MRHSPYLGRPIRDLAVVLEAQIKQRLATEKLLDDIRRQIDGLKRDLREYSAPEDRDLWFWTLARIAVKRREMQRLKGYPSGMPSACRLRTWDEAA